MTMRQLTLLLLSRCLNIQLPTRANDKVRHSTLVGALNSLSISYRPKKRQYPYYLEETIEQPEISFATMNPADLLLCLSCIAVVSCADLQVVKSWRYLEYAYPAVTAEAYAVQNGSYVYQKNVPIDVEIALGTKNIKT